MRIRKKNWRTLYIGLTACFSFCTDIGFSQTIQSFTDKKDILIGEQVQLKIKAILPPGNPGLKNWLLIPDSIPHFDIVDKGKVDSITHTDNSRIFEQTIVFTSFDSGKWTFPSLAADLVHLRGEAEETLNTDSILVTVSYSPADSTDQLRDIKSIIQVSITDYTWYYIIGGILLLLIIIVLLVRYAKKHRKTKPGRSASGLSPFNEAMKEMGNLAKYNLHNADELKIYHTKLSVIFKNYLGRKQEKNLFNKTTGDLLVRMTENNMAPDNISNLATALRCSDAVKFAKYLPAIEESEDCMMKIKASINLIEQQIYPPKL